MWRPLMSFYMIQWLFLNTVAGVRAASEPDERLPVGLLLPVAYLRVPVFGRDVFQGIVQGGAHVVLEPFDHGGCLSRVETFVDIIPEEHNLTSLSLAFYSVTFTIYCP